MKENWFALFLCVKKEISVDKALIKMGIDKSCAARKHREYSDNERKQIFNLKSQGKTYSEIGKMFGISRSQIAGIVRYYKIKNAARTPTKVVQATI